MQWQFFAIFLYFVSGSLSTDPSSCSTYIQTGDDTKIDWTLNIYQNSEINDNDALFKFFPLSNKIVISNLTGNATPYIDAATDGSHLILFSYSNFSDFEEDIPKQESDIVTLSLTFQLQCYNTQLTTLTFIQTIRDVNSHAPVFKQDGYHYNVPMPLPPKIDLTGFGVEIICSDLDFSNQNVIYTLDASDGDYWTLETSSSLVSKDYRTILKVIKFTRLIKDTVLTLTATDSGTPPLTSSTTINITIDTENSLVELPKFSASKYRFTYVVSAEGWISLSGNNTISCSSSSSTDLIITLDDARFGIAYDVETQQVFIGVTQAVELSKDPVIVLTLTASLISHPEVTVTTIVMIDVPNTCDGGN